MFSKEARDKCLNPLRRGLASIPDVQSLIAQKGKKEAWYRVKRAIRWRLGKFYLSAIRELDLLTRLRELGVPLRYQLPEDVLLRLDFWTETRDRQVPAERFFPAIEVSHLKIERQRYGRPSLATDEAVRLLAEQLQESNAYEGNRTAANDKHGVGF